METLNRGCDTCEIDNAMSLIQVPEDYETEEPMIEYLECNYCGTVKEI